MDPTPQTRVALEWPCPRGKGQGKHTEGLNSGGVPEDRRSGESGGAGTVTPFRGACGGDQVGMGLWGQQTARREGLGEGTAVKASVKPVHVADPISPAPLCPQEKRCPSRAHGSA